MLLKSFNFSIFLYFVLFYVGQALYKETDSVYFKVVLLIPLYLHAFLVNFKLPKIKFTKYLYKLVFFYIFYFVVFIPQHFKTQSIVLQISVLIAFLLHLFFWTVVAKYYQFFNNSSFKYSLAFVLIVFIFPAHYFIAGSLEFGAFYEIGVRHLANIPFVMSTIEGPIIAGVIAIIAYVQIHEKREIKFNIFLLLFSLFTLLLFSRRGVVVGVVFIILLFILSKKFPSLRIINSIYFIILTPFFWNIFASILIYIFSFDFVKTLVVRNDASSITDATGRVYAWGQAISALFSFNMDYLWGVGSPLPRIWFPFDFSVRYQHLHNTVLQVFADTGYLVVTYFIYYIFSLMKRVNYYIRKYQTEDRKDINMFLFATLLVFFVFGSESIVKGFYFTNYFFSAIIIVLSTSIDIKAQKI